MKKQIIKELQQEKKRKGYWNLYNPKNLYITDAQGQAYLDIMDNETYSSSFHDKTHILIEENISAITKNFSKKNIHIVDLGPGYPSKTFPIIDALKEKEIEYWAVDGNNYFANISSDAIKKRGVKNCHPKQMLFEDTAKTLNKEIPKLLILGLTIMNFEPNYILPILKECLTSKNDVSLTSIQFIDEKTNIEEILQGYKSKEAEKFNFLLLELLGFTKEDVKYTPQFANNRVEMCFEIKNVPQPLKETGIKVGDTIITAISYRHTLESFKKILSTYFTHNEIFVKDNTLIAVSRL